LGVDLYLDKGPGLVFQSPIILILTVLLAIGLQIAVSYFSFNFFMSGDLLLGLSFFLFVPILGMGIAYYILWFRRQKARPFKAGPGDDPR